MKYLLSQLQKFLVFTENVSSSGEQWACRQWYCDYHDRVSVTKVDGNVLELHKVKKSEAGSYLCIASNGHPPTVSRRVQIDIKCKKIMICRILPAKLCYSSSTCCPCPGAEDRGAPREEGSAGVQHWVLPPSRGDLGLHWGQRSSSNTSRHWLQVSQW